MFQYEEEISANPRNYDIWSKYMKMVEYEFGDDVRHTRETYMNAVRNFPPNHVDGKCATTYMYLWLHYALYEELVGQDVEEIQKIYRTMQELVQALPVDPIKFGLFYAKFEIRNGSVETAQEIVDALINEIPSDQLVERVEEVKMILDIFDSFCNRFHSTL